MDPELAKKKVFTNSLLLTRICKFSGFRDLLQLRLTNKICRNEAERELKSSRFTFYWREDFSHREVINNIPENYLNYIMKGTHFRQLGDINKFINQFGTTIEREADYNPFPNGTLVIHPMMVPKQKIDCYSEELAFLVQKFGMLVKCLGMGMTGDKDIDQVNVEMILKLQNLSSITLTKNSWRLFKFSMSSRLQNCLLENRIKNLVELQVVGDHGIVAIEELFFNFGHRPTLRQLYFMGSSMEETEEKGLFFKEPNFPISNRYELGINKLKIENPGFEELKYFCQRYSVKNLTDFSTFVSKGGSVFYNSMLWDFEEDFEKTLLRFHLSIGQMQEFNIVSKTEYHNVKVVSVNSIVISSDQGQILDKLFKKCPNAEKMVVYNFLYPAINNKEAQFLRYSSEFMQRQSILNVQLDKLLDGNFGFLVVRVENNYQVFRQL